MKATELRIGNYINEPLNENKDPFVVWQIYHEEGNNKVNGYPITYFSPIPLTEEWLVKLGFNKTEYTHIYDNGDYSFRLDRLSLWDYTGDDGYCIAVKILHVHQLQNLYFALTGEELIIKE
jgi:hypothetical protein